MRSPSGDVEPERSRRHAQLTGLVELYRTVRRLPSPWITADDEWRKKGPGLVRDFTEGEQIPASPPQRASLQGRASLAAFHAGGDGCDGHLSRAEIGKQRAAQADPEGLVKETPVRVTAADQAGCSMKAQSRLPSICRRDRWNSTSCRRRGHSRAVPRTRSAPFPLVPGKSSSLETPSRIAADILFRSHGPLMEVRKRKNDQDEHNRSARNQRQRNSRVVLYPSAMRAVIGGGMLKMGTSRFRANPSLRCLEPRVLRKTTSSCSVAPSGQSRSRRPDGCRAVSPVPMTGAAKPNQKDRGRSDRGRCR